MPGRIGQIGHHLNGFPPNLTDSTRHHLNGFPSNSTNLTRHHLNELGGNPLRLHCMPAWLNGSNWVVATTQFDQFDQASSQWISTQFNYWSNWVETH